MSEGTRLPSLDIIIVNWNSSAYLRDCLTSIPGALSEDFRLSQVIVVDNASTDGVHEWIKRVDLDLPLVVVSNDSNLGFAKACNIGAVLSTADYVLFLNPDTRLLSESLKVPILYMEDASSIDIGIVSIRNIGSDGKIKPSCARFPKASHFFAKMLGLDVLFPFLGTSSLMTEWTYDEDRDVDQVIGAFFLIRRCLFEELNGFDERFFVYFEEVDLSLRAIRLGWKSRFLSGASIFHKGGGSSDTARPQRLFYSLRSRLIYCATHFSSISYVAVVVGTVTIEFISRMLFSMITLSRHRVSEALGGYLKIWLDLPAIISVGQSKFRGIEKGNSR